MVRAGGLYLNWATLMISVNVQELLISPLG